MSTSTDKFITARQHQALDAMLAIHLETRTHVGPTEVGARIGISRPSAHELIQQLVQRQRVLRLRRGRYSRYVPVIVRSEKEVVAKAVHTLRKRGEHGMARELEDAFSQ